VTAAELLLGTALLLGIALRWSAYASAGLLVVFALPWGDRLLRGRRVIGLGGSL
jgi:hypothetical protein